MTHAIPLLHILCAARSSVYHHFPALDIYDRARPAWQCHPRRPIIAHPPCRFWSRWNTRAAAPPATLISELLLGVWCAKLVTTYGGILEQPAFSRLWDAAKLPQPTPAKHNAFWSCQVDQAQWGHPTAKPTWLYFARIHPCQVTWSGWTLANPRRLTLAHLTPGQRSATPLPFAQWLVETALHANPPAV